MKQNLYPGPPAAARQKGGSYDDIKRVKKNGKSYREQREGSNCETTNGIWRRSDRKGNSFTGNSNQRVCEVREIKSIIEGMDTDVDEDIVEAMDATREAAKSEGIEHMDSEVHGQLEEGYDVANEAINEGTEQGEKSRQAAADFSSLSDVSEFGSSTAESSAANAENIAEQFDEHVENAEQGIEDSEDRFSELEDDILG